MIGATILKDVWLLLHDRGRFLVPRAVRLDRVGDAVGRMPLAVEDEAAAQERRQAVQHLEHLLGLDAADDRCRRRRCRRAAVGQGPAG